MDSRRAMAEWNLDGAARVLVVGGTHGNERNGVQLLEHWRQVPGSLATSGLAVEFTLGNPGAIAACRRYLGRDLNRSFAPELLEGALHQEAEVCRARELLAAWGPEGATPCAVALDLHSTTAAMGNCLVVYGRRPADLALAAGLQGRLGLPIYLHEGDPAQSGYLAMQWPCGLAIEVGPVAQGVVNATICRQTQLAVETALALLAEARHGIIGLPRQLVVHRHLRSLDLPRDGEGIPCARVHAQRQDRDWQPIGPGEPLFEGTDGSTLGWIPEHGDPAVVWPVFINEAAYEEKGIALSLTQRDTWDVPSSWGEALGRLVGLKNQVVEAKSG
ncbi:MAG: aspartoacylase [Cyanobacteriota bacterium]|nr:aspartoacylase [Cyanobacteriota bacterium]